MKRQPKLELAALVALTMLLNGCAHRQSYYDTGQSAHPIGRTDDTMQVRVLDRRGKGFGMEASIQAIKAVNIKASYAENLRMGVNSILDPLNSQQGAWKMNFDSSVIDGKLKIFAEADSASLQTFNSLQDPSKHQGMMKVGFSGAHGDFSYGAITGFAGYDQVDPLSGKRPDQAWRGKQRTETWAGWQFGDMGVKASLSESSKLRLKLSDPMIQDQEAGLSLNYSFSSWPAIGASISYASGQHLRDENGQAGKATFSAPYDKVAVSGYYSADHWNGYVNSSFSRSTSDMVNGKFPATDISHSIGMSLYPTSAMYLDLSLGLYRQLYDYGARLNTVDGSLSVGYSPEGSKLSFSSSMTYSRSRSAAWNYDQESLYVDNAARWSFSNDPREAKSLSLHVGYHAFTDRFNSGSNWTDPYIGLVFNLGHPSGLFLNQYQRGLGDYSR